MEDVVVFAALAWEAASALDGLQGVERLGPRAWRGYLGDGAAVRVLQVGLGLDRAAAAAAAAPPARAFLSCGCAGALASGLAPGDMVLGTRVVALDPNGGTSELAVAADPIARWAAGRGVALGSGAVASSRVVLADAAAKRRAARTGALVVEMESAAIVAAARLRQIPCAAVKVVLDEADLTLDLPADGLVDGATGDLDVRRAIATIAVHPRRWPAVVRLARAQRVAEHRLREFLAMLFSAGLDALGLAPGVPEARVG